MKDTDRFDTLLITERHDGNYDIGGDSYSVNQVVDIIKSHKTKCIRLLEDKGDNNPTNNIHLINFCRSNNIHVDVYYPTSASQESGY